MTTWRDDLIAFVNDAGGDLCAFFGAVLGVAVGVLLLKITEKHRDKIEIKVEKI